MRWKLVCSLVGLVVVVGAVLAWALAPTADAATNVRWFSGPIEVAQGAGDTIVGVHNATTTNRDATVIVRDATGTMVNVYPGGDNLIQDLPPDQIATKAFSCATSSCTYSVEVITNSTLVVPSVVYQAETSAGTAASTIPANGFRVKVTKT